MDQRVNLKLLVSLLSKLRQKLILCYKKCMVMHIYHELKFLGVKIQGGTKNNARPGRHCTSNRTQKLNKLVSWSAKIVVWAFKLLLRSQESTKNVFVRFYKKHTSWRILDSSPGQCASPSFFVCEGVLCKIHHTCVRPSSVLTLRRPLWFLFISKG